MAPLFGGAGGGSEAATYVGTKAITGALLVGAAAGAAGTAPATTLHVVFDGDTSGGIYPRGILCDSIDNTAHSAHVEGRKARGTRAAPAVLQTNDYQGAFVSSGYDGSAYQQTGYIAWITASSPSAGSVPSKFVIATQTEGFAMGPTGNVCIGGSSGGYSAPAFPLSMRGRIRVEGNGGGATGQGLEIGYNSATPEGIIAAYDQDGAIYKPVRFGGTILTFQAGSGASIATMLQLNNASIGFYGATPVARQLLATGAAHTVDEVITALQNLGLVRQS